MPGVRDFGTASAAGSAGILLSGGPACCCCGNVSAFCFCNLSLDDLLWDVVLALSQGGTRGRACAKV